MASGAGDGAATAVEEVNKRIEELQQLFASRNIQVKCKVKSTRAQDSEEGNAHEDTLNFALRDPSEPLRYPDHGSMYDLIARCYSERRKLLVYGVETERRNTLRIHAPLGKIAYSVLNQCRGSVDKKQLNDMIRNVAQEFTLEIEGATRDATIAPGIAVQDGVTVKLRGLTLQGSKHTVFGGDGSALSPLLIQQYSNVEAYSCAIRAGDEPANPSYCVHVQQGGILRLQDCDLTATHQEFALCAQAETRLELVRSRVAGIYANQPESVVIKHCEIVGNANISATGLFASDPAAVEIVDNCVHDFRHTGFHIRASSRPNPCVIERNTVSKCGEFGIESNEAVGSQSTWLKNNTVSNNAWGQIRMRSSSSGPDGPMDHRTTRLGQVRESLSGKFCDGCLELKLSIKTAERMGHCFDYYAVTALNAKGALVGSGTVPLLTAARQGVFLCGDAGVCELDSNDRLIGIRWDNGDFWPKLNTAAATKKIPNKAATKICETLIKERKKAALLRDRAAGPDPDAAGYVVKASSSGIEHRNPQSSSIEDVPSGTSSPQSASELQQPETEDLSNAVAECVVCMCAQSERPIDWIFSKCGHRCLCKRCARKLRAFACATQVECPLCRTVSEIVPIHAYKGVRVFEAAID